MLSLREGRALVIDSVAIRSVQGMIDLNPGLTPFKWAILSSYNFVVSIIGFISKESPVVGVGKARERLGSNRVSIKNDKDIQENREGGLVEGTWSGQQSPGHGCPSRRSFYPSGCGVSYASSPPPHLLSLICQ